VIGVFLGVQASNWNQARLEKRQIEQLLHRMQPELARMRASAAVQLRYYEITRRFADIALAGWAEHPKVANRDFVVGAYQASQVVGSANVSPLAMILDNEDVRKIDDPALQSALLRVVNFNYYPISSDAMLTRYREHVRETIPADIQDSIRRECGDRLLPNGMLILPTDCPISIAQSSADEAAAKLRSHPELAGELEFHLAQLSQFEQNTIRLDERVANLQKLLEAK
jgi:hypothetical protein